MIKMPDGKELAQELAKALPVYCYVDNPTKRLLAKQGVSINEKTRLEVIEVRYMGEAGGITCVVKQPDGDGVLAMSATQVRFPNEGVVYDKINVYREERIQWLRQEETKDKMLGRGGRVNIAKKNKDGSMRFSGSDGTEIITFAKESSQADVPNVIIPGNSFCPCGSGKKYKKCCGAQ
jgi:hypothetical protein